MASSPEIILIPPLTSSSTGAIGLEGPILAHDLRQMVIGTRTSELFCLTIFGLCPWPTIEAYTVEMTPKPSTSRPAPSGQTPREMVHISDIHVDLSYETGANYNCTKNICCRPYTAADAPGNTSYPAGQFVSFTIKLNFVSQTNPTTIGRAYL